MPPQKQNSPRWLSVGKLFRYAGECTLDTDPRLPVASMIYSPSYISFGTALAYHQLIPECTHAIMSAAFRLNKEKYFDTPFGRYSFYYSQRLYFTTALNLQKREAMDFVLLPKRKPFVTLCIRFGELNRGSTIWRSEAWKRCCSCLGLAIDKEPCTNLSQHNP